MRIFLLFAVLLFAGSALATEKDAIADSVFLQEVTSYGSYRRYQPGTKIDRILASQMQIGEHGNLEKLISRFSPIYIKGNAGGLSTIRFRGTAPDHTAINFGGININSLTLGHSNMTKIPVFLFDHIDLQYGSSSAINGSGAIGGAIYLEQANNWTSGFKSYSMYSNGSYGEGFLGQKLYFGNGRWESATKIYNYKNKNRFSFKNPYHKNRFTDSNPIKDRQNGAAINNKGILQQANYRISSGQTIKSSFWYEESWHQVQPNMPSNIDYVSTEELDNKNFRSWAEYANNNSVINHKIGAGYVKDKQIYNNNNQQLIATERLITDGSLSYSITEKHEVRLGAKYEYIVPNVYAYLSENIKYEERADIYLSYLVTPIKNLKTAINIRQPHVTNFKSPLTPSVMAEYTVLSLPSTMATISAGASKSYRIPTLNDRFWANQGNPNLKPESGINFEGGFSIVNEHNFGFNRFKVNAFYMDVKNWIEWRNFGLWIPRNILNVVSKGIETQMHSEVQLSNIRLQAGVNHTYNPVQRISDISMQVNNQQLVYVPKHIANMFVQIKHNNTSYFADLTYTGERFFDYVGNKLPTHLLTNVGISYKIAIHNHFLNLSSHVDNLFNNDYQNERNYAMPGRTYKLSASLDINIYKH